ncbi:hypothetical protein GLOTRDRAFT_48407 [Gloeophyllum trabeum ATCC 11539]|uniref:Peptidase C19 ubiquitin carboxyl-terminal hydrolase domain-containing protein n=1 Tax=Gloeophyllum trabeum (strain ATCC 11539 / FP-39264 / Madison 617) TaxID=670483 RepID=S7PWM2_GLOTA|nr:uncharacterized protein GLOTRDRAFT_48407 [Gloeophyllum trabeum ATCC 11539]EPQ51958.1 hypothetical protein GLOTRDRAFT_48407 [Gloeophyllum trabeum ATCC 11539]
MTSTAISPEEQENVEFLTSMMAPGDVDAEVARRLLLKHGNDIQKAAYAMLEGDRAEEYQAGPRSPPREYRCMCSLTLPASKPEKDVIDLTADEESEMEAAIKMSMEADLRQHQQQFGPSNRAPDPNWAMVASNKPAETNALSQDDQTLSRAIEESLATSYSRFEKEEFYERPMEEQVRKDKRPIALRPTQATLHYAGLVLQALYSVPQVRESIANWRPTPPASATADEFMIIEPPKSGPESLMYGILEVFANMEFALLSELSVDPILQEFGTQPASAADNFGDLTEQFLGKVTYTVETILNGDYANASSKRLFHFQYGTHVDPNSAAHVPDLHEKAIVRVDIHGTEQTNDLVSCLLSQFSPSTPSGTQEVIYQPSDVVSFHLVRPPPPYPGVSTEGSANARTVFKYPKHFYLDQFLEENAELAKAKTAEQKEIEQEVVRLRTEKNGIVNYKNKDALSNLAAATHFYEHVIDRDTPEQQTYADMMAEKLHKVQANIQAHIKSIEDKMTELRSRSEALFDDPQLKKHRYDLRAVLVNEGPLGRKHLYSYTYNAGKWWKTVDWLVEEVRRLHCTVVSEEVVLNDPAGLHYGAGPYLLLYSRALSEEDEKTLSERLHWMETARVGPTLPPYTGH